jgi:general stress protein 26
MKEEVLKYLQSQRVGVLGLALADGSIHGATLHYASSASPFVLFFLTGRSSRKATPLLQGQQVQACFVIGTDESDKKTLQMEGTLQMVGDEEQERFEAIYFGKLPEKKQSYSDSSVGLQFIPRWWRFSDWTLPEPLVVSSE